MSSSGSSSALGTSDIVGIVVGGVLALVTIIGLGFSFYTMCCKKNKQAQVWAEPTSNYPQNSGYGQQMNTGYYPQQPPYQQPPGQKPPYQQPPYQQPPYQQPSWNKQPTTNEQPPDYSTVYSGNNPYGKN